MTLQDLDVPPVLDADGRGHAEPANGQPHDAVDPSLVAEIRKEVAQALSSKAPNGLARRDREALASELVARALERLARDRLAKAEMPLSVEVEAALAASVRAELFGLGRLEPLLEDPSITDIHVVGCEPVLLDLADGSKGRAQAVARSDDELIDLIRAVGRNEGITERRFDFAHPQLNQQLRDGSRLFAVAWVTRRPHLFIRRHRLLDVTVGDLVALSTLTESLGAFLAAAARSRQNILVAGGMGSGKTTLLRALLAEADPDERIVTVETDYELALDRFPERHHDLIALEAREANVEGVGTVNCADLVRWAMRMAASRLAVGEVLGSEVIPMLNAMHSGASGSMCTVHANSSADALAKLALLAVQSPERLDMAHTYALASQALDLVLFLARDGRGRRVVQSVREVTGFDGRQVTTNEIWAPGPDGVARRTAVSLTEHLRGACAKAGYRDGA
ncbi:MAG TPA: type II secretion system protein E [Acidimicrobiaceae bacterium]|nr:type II secretion system protein E [Acidimicrobiaceae bacterium]